MRFTYRTLGVLAQVRKLRSDYDSASKCPQFSGAVWLMAFAVLYVAVHSIGNGSAALTYPGMDEGETS